MISVADEIMFKMLEMQQQIELAKSLADKVIKRFGRHVFVFKDGSKLCFYPKQSREDDDLLTFYTPV